MTMAIEIGIYGGLIPVAVAIVILRLAPRALPSDYVARGVAALAFAAAYFVGYALLPEWAPIAPSRHWHWIPHLAWMAVIVGPVSLAGGVAFVERGLVRLLLAGAAGFLLVPDWSDLVPGRLMLGVSLGTGLIFLVTLLDALPARVGDRLFVLVLAGVACVASAGLTLFVSMKYGQICGIAAAALFGCAVVRKNETPARWARGVIPAYAVVVGGAVFVGAIEPKPPLWGLLLLPAAPLGLWLCERGPAARLEGKPLLAVRLGAVWLVLAVGLGLAWAAE